ncbi:MAG: hypothetical protein IT439_07900 [Phycisphaerales bacterium]|nr:hypothetical protein [Phycisphaerales bacterium]
MKRSICAVLAAGACVAAPALATDASVTFGFTDLSGAFDLGTGLFNLANDADSSGDVSRLEAPGGVADYNVGFAAPAAVAFSVSVFNKAGNLAQGIGTFTITDADGDTLSGDVTGTWIQGLLGINFNGDLANVVFTSDDGTFDGPSGGSFSTTLSGTPPYIGAVVQLFVPPSGNFFDSTFDVESVQVLGEIIPAPASLGVLGLAGLGATRRRRSR